MPLDTLSRLKGIETESEPMIQSVQYDSALDTLSRLKGIGE